jgi:hypothetical protein
VIYPTTYVRIWDEKTKEFIVVKVSLTIDIDAIAFALAKRANGSKTRKATAMHGAIKATIPPRPTIKRKAA